MNTSFDHGEIGNPDTDVATERTAGRYHGAIRGLRAAIVLRDCLVELGPHGCLLLVTRASSFAGGLQTTILPS
jgi:hypothetical protein